MQGVYSFENFVLMRCSLVLQKCLCPLHLVNLFGKVHLILDHALLILLCKGLSAKLNDVKLFNAFIGLRHKGGTPLLHHVIDAFLETVLDGDVIELFAKALFQVGDLRFELPSDVALEELHLLCLAQLKLSDFFVTDLRGYLSDN